VKRVSLTLACAATLSCTGLISSRADDHGRHRALLKALQTNAQDVQRNAAISQWVRVNREVDRIVFDEKKLQKTMVSHTELKPHMESVRQTVSALRSARLKRNSDRAVDAAKKLADLTADLLKKEG
jgi:protoporphyrinogen oxidase